MGNMATENAASNRIAALLDAGSFVEIGGAVTARSTDFNLGETKTPADGVITGYGVIDGNLVYVYSQDATVLKGAVGEMHAKKIANIYDMAMKMGAPVIGLVDCAGLRLQESTDALEAFGNLYLKQAKASGVIPQITAIFGSCGGGLSVIPGLTDFTFMEEKSKLFVNSPNAIPGNTEAKCDTASASYQSEKAGLVDAVGTEEDVLENIRTLVCMLPCNNEEDASYAECEDDLNRACTEIENAVEDTAIFGSCGGGLSVIPGLTDFTFMEEKSKLFVNSPNAIPGNTEAKCDTASASYQSEKAGLVDAVGTEEDVLENIRTLVCMLPCNNEEDASYAECEDDLNRACTEIENAVEDTAIALSQIADSGIFFETKKDFAKDMVTGFIKLNGMTVGAVANRSKVYDDEAKVVAEFDGSLSADGARKAADFVAFCDAFNVPVLTLTNVAGFAASEYDESHLAKEVAKMTYAFAEATVPKVNVIIGKAFGSSYVAMNSKSTGADVVYAWPSAEIGMMDAKLAAKIMYADKDAATISEKAAEYKELQSSPLSAARRGYVDTIVEPADTRKYVIGAFEMLFTKREEQPLKKHGTV